jgi:HPt (histidine-containing phosphotransfer) domain-containing protein
MNPKQKEAFEALRKKYINSIPEKIINLQKAITIKDELVLEQESHKIKGSGKTYGFQEISELAYLVNKNCRDKNPNAIVIAEKVCVLLQKIYDGIQSGNAFDLQNDPLYKEIL